jgi:hypothetical protein
MVARRSTTSFDGQEPGVRQSRNFSKGRRTGNYSVNSNNEQEQVHIARAGRPRTSPRVEFKKVSGNESAGREQRDGWRD